MNGHYSYYKKKFYFLIVFTKQKRERSFLPIKEYVNFGVCFYKFSHMYTVTVSSIAYVEIQPLTNVSDYWAINFTLTK